MGIGRSRLSVAISKDDGRTWGHFKNIESLDDRTKIEPLPLGTLVSDKSEDVAIAARARDVGVVRTQPIDELPDLSDYPYAGNSPDRQGFLLAEYPSISFLSDERVAISYDVVGGPWNFEGPRAHLGEGKWINEKGFPGLVVMIAPLEWFYH